MVLVMTAVWVAVLAGIRSTLVWGNPRKHNEGSFAKVWVECGAPDEGCLGPLDVGRGPLQELWAWVVESSRWPPSREQAWVGDERPILNPIFC